MKIAIIGQKGIPAVSGGVEKHVEDLSVRLVKVGHEVIVYTRPNYTDKALKEYKGARLVSLPSIPTKNLDAISHTFLASLDVIFRRKVDIIHFHSIGPSSLIWLVKLLKPRTPVIATFHTRCYFHKKWGSFAKWYLKFGEFVMHKLADEVIAISKTLKQYSKEKYGREVVCVPNGVVIPEIASAKLIREKWGLEKDGYFLSVSRLVKHKGIQYLTEAYKNLNTDKKLVIAGDGFFTDNYVRELKKTAEDYGREEKNPNKKIIFTGALSGKILAEIFSNAFLFVQPSESEGLSLALLEAMSYGRPVLVSDIKENLEAIGDTGFTFKGGNVFDLAARLKYLSDHPDEMAAAGIKAESRVFTAYNWDDLWKKIENTYERTIENKRRPGMLLRFFKYINFN
ncbi:MAG: glycosyltransferase family 4 protein [Patescibacteria group bacterium]|jgi:glycosyltransferase involved in cell wall biosynthesis